MKNLRLIPVFSSPKGPKARAKKTGINFMIFILIFVEIVCNSMLYIHNFSVMLRAGSNPADSNRFRSHTGKYFKGSNLSRGRRSVITLLIK